MKTRNLLLGIFSMALFFGFAIGIVIAPADMSTRSAKTDLNTDLSIGFAATISDVNLSVSPSTSLKDLGSHTLNIVTNSVDGYTVAINTKTSETALTSETTSDRIEAIGGTVAAPVALTADTWGYALADGTTEPTTSSSFIGVTDTATTFYTSTTSNEDGDPLEVYFAANVSDEVEAGTYSNTVVYTVSASTDVTTIPAPTIESVTPNFGAIEGGDEITIVGTNFTKNGDSITTGIKIGDSLCTDVTILADTPEAGKDTIKCTTPARTTPGTVAVSVTTWGGTATSTDAFSYTESEILYVTPDTASIEAGSESGPVFTISGKGFVNDSDPVTAVYIGAGHACSAYTIVSDTQITCTKGPNDGTTTTGERTVYVVHQSGARSGSNVSVNYINSGYETLVEGTAPTCDTSAKTLVRDARDSQLYYVQKMADGKCWMVDNLKYGGFGALSQVSGKALSNDGTNTSTTGNYTVAKFVDPNAQDYCMGTTNISSETITRCGLIYNWYAVTNGTGDDSLTTLGENASGSICPVNFKLPSSIVSGGQTSISYSNVASYATADYPVLVASLNNGSETTGVKATDAKNMYAGLLPSGDWSGIYSGNWGTSFGKVGSQGYFWTSSVATKSDGKLRAHNLSFKNGEVQTGDGSYANDTRNYGFAARCVGE